MITRRVMLLAVATVVASNCSPVSTAPSTTTVPVTTVTSTATTVAPTTTTGVIEPVEDAQNLRLAAHWLQPLAEGGAFGVAESSQNVDLNGDGDLNDVIVHVVAEDRVVDTGLAAPWGVTALPTGGFVVERHEAEEAVDLNGDGRTDSNVPVVWTIDEGPVNLGVDGRATPGFDGSIWVSVYEAGESKDLNGDGDIGSEHVVHRWRSGEGWTNTGWSAGGVYPRPDGSVILGVFEEEQGATDLDGDGSDTGHVAVWWRDPDHAEVIGPAYTVTLLDDGGALVSSNAGPEWSLTMWHPDRPLVEYPIGAVNFTPIPGGGAYFRVAESDDYWNPSTACDRGRDRNGDGDCEDFILHLWTPDAGLVDLGVGDGWCPECDSDYVVVGTDAFVAAPPDPGLTDLDGDQWHFVLHLVHNGTATGLGLAPRAASMAWAVLDDGVVLATGDGPTFHQVTLEGRVRDLGLIGRWASPLSTGGAVLLGDESLAGVDLNGDSRTTGETLVVHLWDPDSGMINTGLTVAWWEDEVEGRRPSLPVELGGGQGLAVLVSEAHHGDLNGNGNADDAIVHVIHPCAYVPQTPCARDLVTTATSDPGLQFEPWIGRTVDVPAALLPAGFVPELGACVGDHGGEDPCSLVLDVAHRDDIAAAAHQYVALLSARAPDDRWEIRDAVFVGFPAECDLFLHTDCWAQNGADIHFAVGPRGQCSPVRPLRAWSADRAREAIAELAVTGRHSCQEVCD